MIRRGLGTAWRIAAPGARHCVQRLAGPGARLAGHRWRRQLSDKRDSEGLDEWNRSVSEAIDQAKRELAEQKAKKSPAQQATDGGPAPPKNGDPAPPKDSGGGGGGKGEEPDDYVVTLGRVMIELPEQIEGFFERGLNGSIYAEGIKFVDPRHSGAHIAGKSQYLGAARVLRLAMAAYFNRPRVTILRMRQVRAPADPNHHPEGSAAGTEVLVRWVFEGIPRHTELLGGHGSRFEGEFRYAIDPRSGLVAVHEVAAIHPTPPTSFIASGIARWMGWAAPRGSLSLSQQR
ncbi:hypothetical protein H4R19_000563 [Coemansia spiralis]|nr:hypothetical protein H4R19_000563 [Coemansia spiralis]